MKNLAATLRAKHLLPFLLAAVATTWTPRNALWAQIPFTPVATICADGSPGNSASGGLAYQASLNRFIVQCGGQLWSVDGTSFAVTPFAQSCGLPLPPLPFEHSIAVSTGLGGFPADFIYWARGSTIFQIGPAGTPCTFFADVGGGFMEKVALAFDYNSTAPFLNQLVAVRPDGLVVRVAASGSPITTIATLPSFVGQVFEDAVVTPPAFGAFGDSIITLAEIGGLVWSVSSGSVVSPFGSITLSPDSLCILPPTTVTGGAPSGVFTVQSDSFLYAAAASNFISFGNHILIGPENGGVVFTIGPSGGPGTPHPATVGPSATCPSGFCFEQQMVCIVEKCPLTRGFWKNHRSAWPVTSLTLGGATYTQAQLLVILSAPSTGDASLILADQLIAAKLNIANGANPAQISAIVATADALLTGCNLNSGPGCGVSPSSTTGQAMIAAASTLDTYNNGQFTPNCHS